MKLLTEYTKRSHDFLWGEDLGTCAAEEEPGMSADILPHEAEVEKLLVRVDEAVSDSLHGSSLRELAMASVPPDEK